MCHSQGGDSSEFFMGAVAMAELVALGPGVVVPVAMFTESIDVPAGKWAESNSTSTELTSPSRNFALVIRFSALIALFSPGAAGAWMAVRPAAARPAEKSASTYFTMATVRHFFFRR